MERNPDRWDNYPIHQVGRATSAAPFYFKAVNLDKDDPDLELIDGGFGANNPSEEAYREVGQMCNDNPKAVKVLVHRHPAFSLISMKTNFLKVEHWYWQKPRARSQSRYKLEVIPPIC